MRVDTIEGKEKGEGWSAVLDNMLLSALQLEAGGNTAIIVLVRFILVCLSGLA